MAIVHSALFTVPSKYTVSQMVVTLMDRFARGKAFVKVLVDNIDIGGGGIFFSSKRNDKTCPFATFILILLK